MLPMKEREKKFKDTKSYKMKIKRHKDAILKLQSVDGIAGNLLISGSADHTVRIWNLENANGANGKDKRPQISERIDV